MTKPIYPQQVISFTDPETNEFIETRWLAKHEGKVWTGRTQTQLPDAWELDLRHEPKAEHDLESFFPIYQPNFTKAIGAHSPLKFCKQPDLLTNIFDGFQTQAILAREARTCEKLKENPHPNLAQYFGVLVDEKMGRLVDPRNGKTKALGRITGLVFKRYNYSLADMVYLGVEFDVPSCLENIEAGIDHLHELGIIHCDIKPANVFAEKGINGWNFLVGDFDSCHKKGELYDLKWGTAGWTLDSFRRAHRENDFYALMKLRKWLEIKGPGGYDLDRPTKLVLDESKWLEHEEHPFTEVKLDWEAEEVEASRSGHDAEAQENHEGSDEGYHSCPSDKVSLEPKTGASEADVNGRRKFRTYSLGETW